MVKIEQMYTHCLAQAAYCIISGGEMAVVDPLREVKPYIDFAAKNQVKIKYIFETHFHADFVSGHVDLAKSTGAAIVYGPLAKPSFPAIIAGDGTVFPLGEAKITVLHTPGHTMESSTYLLRDEAGKDVAIFSGDTLFLGDVGRPDLAQKAASMTQEQLAALLYQSLRTKIMTLPDDIVVYPGHGEGSACGKKLSSQSSDTLGNQKQTNYALNPKLTCDEFVKELTTGIQPPPEYFPGNVAKNITPSDVHIEEHIKQVLEKKLSASQVDALLKEASHPLIVDTRDMADFIKGHIPGSVFCGINGGFAPWIATAFPDLHRPIVFISPSDMKTEEIITRLARVGLDHIVGYLSGGFSAWEEGGFPVEKVNVVSPHELYNVLEQKAPMSLIDLRKPGEVQRVSLAGAIELPISATNMAKIPQDKDVYLLCGMGYRALICYGALAAEYGFKGKRYYIDGGMQKVEQCTELKKYLKKHE